jgi:DMSO/TMAO reductase YedYZ molybdopterin-dependent catalytic subunit
MTHVKWLTRITVVDEPFTGYQQTHAYVMRRGDEDPGEPLTRIYPRALMIPPGLPEFPTRDRTLAAGRVTIEGRAWSGWAPVAAVDVSTDGGTRWAPAELDPAGSRWAWRGWRFEWEAEPGERVLCCRARDEAGNEQPNEADWNVGGYANNGIQRVPLTVL